MLNRITYKSHSSSNTRQIANFFVDKFLNTTNRTIVLLKGDLGSGKTTFTRYVLNFLEISDNEFEGSPTFTIINEYKNNIFHIDLYRLETEEELENIGLFEILDRKGIFFIEWPKMFGIKADVLINFKVIDGNTRKITIDKCQN